MKSWLKRNKYKSLQKTADTLIEKIKESCEGKIFAKTRLSAIFIQKEIRKWLKEKHKKIKLLNNYIPVKKTNAYSNISEYETEISIQKNFSNKCQQSKNNMQAKSVQTTHNNQTSVNKYTNTNNNEKEKANQTQNKPARGSLYNLNNLNLGDYFSEKIIMTQQK